MEIQGRAMAPTPKTRSEKRAVNVQVSLKAIVPAVPQTQEGRQNLEEDLERIGCAGLLNKPKSLKDKSLVWELIFEMPN